MALDAAGEGLEHHAVAREVEMVAQGALQDEQAVVPVLELAGGPANVGARTCAGDLFLLEELEQDALLIRSVRGRQTARAREEF